MESIEEKLDYIVKETQKRECSCDYTISVWADIWLNTFKVPNLRASSIDKYKRIIKHIKKHFGDMKIAKLDVVQCQNILNSIDKPSIKDDCYSLLMEMLKKAVQLRYIEFNPLDAIEIKKHKKEHGRAMPHEEEERFVQACKNDKYSLYFLICLYGGLRRGEALALTYEDIDLQNRRIDVNKQLQDRKIVPTKTDGSTRVVPIFDDLLPYVSELDFSKKGRIFSISTTTVLDHRRKILKEAQITDLTVHDLRHTFCTRCCEKGIPITVTQKWSGHTTPDMLNRIYLHINNDFEQSQIEKYNKEVNDTYSQEKIDH